MKIKSKWIRRKKTIVYAIRTQEIIKWNKYNRFQFSFSFVILIHVLHIGGLTNNFIQIQTKQSGVAAKLSLLALHQECGMKNLWGEGLITYLKIIDLDSLRHEKTQLNTEKLQFRQNQAKNEW